jgi:Peptidase inhibitor I78 family
VGRVLAAGLLIGLAACVPVDAPEQPAPIQGGTCGAGALQGLVGQPSTVLHVMKFAGPVRFIRPGMAVTMDYRDNRLNIDIDASETITRVVCG